MPPHQRAAECCRGGPVSSSCSCVHCTLLVCLVCESNGLALTTDCPGSAVSLDRQREVVETWLDYTDARGWHQSKQRSPRFEPRACSEAPPRTSEAVDAVLLAASSSSHLTGLRRLLAQRAIAWVLADRICDDHSAMLTRVEEEVTTSLQARKATSAQDLALLQKLDREKVGFHLADQRAQRCDDEFRQAARDLVAALEKAPSAAASERKDGR